MSEELTLSWTNELAEANAEIGRLRAEKAEANNQWRLDYNACAAERDRLRAGLEALLFALEELRKDEGSAQEDPCQPQD